MRQFFFSALCACAFLLAAPLGAIAQAPPGWGWANKLGAYVPNATSENGVAGLGRDAAGNLYLLGTTAATAPRVGAPAGSAGGSDVFLAKYDPAGALLWRRTLQSSGDDKASALAVEPSGRCTLAGYYGSVTGDNLSLASFSATAPPLAGPALLGLPAAGGRYPALTFVAAVDANGALLWADTPSPVYGGLDVTALHRDGAGNCYVSANIPAQGQLLVGGQNYPPIGNIDAVLLKYSAAGQVASVRRVGVVGGSAYSAEIKTDNADALYWVLGHSGTITVDQTTIGVGNSVTANSLVKISAANRVKWIKNDLLRVGSGNVVSQLLNFDSGSNALYLSGYSSGAPLVFTGTGGPVSVQAEPNAFTSFVAQCDTAGRVQWAKAVVFARNVPGGLPGPRGGVIRALKARGNGFTLVTRTVEYNETIFYGSLRVYGLSEGGLSCVLHFNINTNQAEWIRLGGIPVLPSANTFSETKDAVIDATGNAYLAGTFAGTAPFGATTLVSASVGQPEIFLAKLDQSVLTAAKAGTAGPSWSVFPNPATGAAQLTGLPAPAQVRVYDAQGRLVQQLPPAPTADAPRTLSGLAPGLYLLQVTGTAAPYPSRRLVVQ